MYKHIMLGCHCMAQTNLFLRLQIQPLFSPSSSSICFSWTGWTLEQMNLCEESTDDSVVQCFLLKVDLPCHPKHLYHHSAKC